MNVLFLLFAVLPIIVVIMLGSWDDFTPTCCGIAAAVLSIRVETSIYYAFTEYRLHLTFGQQAFALFGFPEEILKYLSLAMVSQLNASGRRVVKNGIFCGIGFASIENFLYTVGFLHSIADTGVFAAASLLRFFLPFMMHSVTGPILVSGHCIKGFRPVGGISLAVLFHGTYDTVASSSSLNTVGIEVIFLLFGFVAAALIYRNAKDTRES